MADLPGPLLVDIPGTRLDAEDREVLAHPLVGGAILFTRNFASPGQLRALCDELHELRPSNPLLVTVDHEGGRVQRFIDGFTRLPAARTHGVAYRDDPAAGLESCHTHGKVIATELRACGVDMSFAPVLDLDRGLGSVIGDRAFAADADDVSKLGAAWIAGMHVGGMAACGKHFPGHGGVAGDSHLELPVDDRPLAQLRAEDLVPFAGAIEDGLDAVMMAHVSYPEVDETPASLSPVWIGELLRGEFGFRGAVFCDDLSMAGAVAFGGAEARARAALAAGCDMLPVCNDRAAVIGLLDTLRVTVDRERGARIAALRRVGT